MASSAQARRRNAKRSLSEDHTATTARDLERELSCTPPPPSASAPIAGTPITPKPDNKPAPPPQTVSPIHSPQAATQKTPIDNALKILNTILYVLNEPYAKVYDKVEKGELDPNKASFTLSFQEYAEIGRGIKEAHHQLLQHKNCAPEVESHFSRLEHMLKETITATVKKTYASAIVTPTPETNRVRETQQQNLEHKIQQRREQSKLEVTLTTQEMDPEIKEQLAQQTHAEITAKLQQTIESQMKENPPILHGIQKLKSQDIRILCKTQREAQQLRKLKWDKIYNGLKVHQPKYGIVIHGIPTTSINPNELQDPELAKQIQHQNKDDGLQIMGMKTLKRKLKDQPRHFSLVMFVSSPDTADRYIKHGIYIQQQRFPAEKYTPQFQLIQCYKCQQFGHHATRCRSPHEVCAKCSENHPTSQCQSKTYKCAICKEEHPTWHEDCPNKTNIRQNLINRKRGAPVYYNE
jgi:hypothetical protein